MKIVHCRRCQTAKVSGDPCAGCGAGLPVQTMKVRKSQPISLMSKHGFHALQTVTSAQAHGNYRRSN